MTGSGNAGMTDRPCGDVPYAAPQALATSTADLSYWTDLTIIPACVSSPSSETVHKENFLAQ